MIDIRIYIKDLKTLCFFFNSQNLLKHHNPRYKTYQERGRNITCKRPQSTGASHPPKQRGKSKTKVIGRNKKNTASTPEAKSLQHKTSSKAEPTKPTTQQRKTSQLSIGSKFQGPRTTRKKDTG
jgi:hypothetical protein